MSNELLMQDLFLEMANADTIRMVAQLTNLYGEFAPDTTLQSYLDRIDTSPLSLGDLAELNSIFVPLLHNVRHRKHPITYTDGAETVIAIGDIVVDPSKPTPSRIVSLAGDIEISPDMRSAELIIGRNVLAELTSMRCDAIIANHVTMSHLQASYVRVSNALVCNNLTEHPHTRQSNFNQQQPKIMLGSVTSFQGINANKIITTELIGGCAHINALIAERIVADSLDTYTVVGCKILNVNHLGFNGEYEGNVKADRISVRHINAGNKVSITAKSLTVVGGMTGRQLSLDVEKLYAEGMINIERLKAKDACFSGCRDAINIRNFEVENSRFINDPTSSPLDTYPAP